MPRGGAAKTCDRASPIKCSSWGERGLEGRPCCCHSAAICTAQQVIAANLPSPSGFSLNCIAAATAAAPGSRCTPPDPPPLRSRNWVLGCSTPARSSLAAQSSSYAGHRLHHPLPCGPGPAARGAQGPARERGGGARLVGGAGLGNQVAGEQGARAGGAEAGQAYAGRAQRRGRRLHGLGTRQGAGRRAGCAVQLLAESSLACAARLQAGYPEGTPIVPPQVSCRGCLSRGASGRSRLARCCRELEPGPACPPAVCRTPGHLPGCAPQDLLSRPRRNRKSEAVRRAFSETVVLPANFILPVFVHDGDKVRRRHRPQAPR